MKSNTIQRSKSISKLLNNDLLHVFYLPDSTLEVVDFKEGKNDYLRLGEGRELRYLIEFGEFCSATSKARSWAEKNSPEAIAEALVIRNLAQRILAKFYLNFRKNKHPCQIFNSAEGAQVWVLTF